MKEKLIRDKIVASIIKDGKGDRLRVVEGTEYRKFLFAKLLEEAQEVIDAKGPKHREEEIGDLMEVIGAIVNEFSLDYDDIEDQMALKSYQKGDFDGGYILRLEDE
jgi:predicted house-cleaning noncanonical NTP pyrophosphatase (MazG superfamily)